MTHASKHLKPAGAPDWIDSLHRVKEEQERQQRRQRQQQVGPAPERPRVPVSYAQTPPPTMTSFAASANLKDWSDERSRDRTAATLSPAWATPRPWRPDAGDAAYASTPARDPDPVRARRGKFSIQFTQKKDTPPSRPTDLGQTRSAASPVQIYQYHIQQADGSAGEAVRTSQMADPGFGNSADVPLPSFEQAAPASDTQADILQPFLPQDLKMPPVLLDPKWPGFRISALCLGSFDERGLGYFAVERDVHIQQGLLDFSGLSDKGKKASLGIGGYAFDDAPGIKLSFTQGCISSLYWSPAPAGPDEDPDLERIYLVIGTRWTPRFYAYISHRTDRHVTSQVRVSAFDERHARQVPYLSRHFLVVVDLVKGADASNGSTVMPASLPDFLRHCSSSDLPVPKELKRLELHKERRYSRDVMHRLDETLSTLSPTHAYQLEGILRDGTLTPHEIGRLIEEHVKVWSVTVEIDRDSTVEEILVELRNQLVEDRKARAALFSLGVQTPEQLQAMPVEVSHMADLAREAVLYRARVKLDEPDRLGGSAAEKVESRTHFWCRGIVLTPSGCLKVTGRMLEKSNATIRRYYHDVDTHRESDHFLRVAFRDEDEQSLQVVSAGEIGIAQKRLLDASVTKALKRGVRFAGRTYEFLAYSQSGLRDRSVWFVAPWEDVDRHGEPYTMTAERIRQQLGLFDKVNRQPAKLGARFSQGFTSSVATVLLHHTKIGSRPDIVERDDEGEEITNHTDGAGVMSKQLRDEVWQALLANGFHRDQDGPPPSVFQIRLGGSKGVIAIDDTLEGSQVQLRPSQDKFRGFAERTGVSNNFCLTVSDAFTRPNPLRLNRPLVSALEDLGIEKEIFLAYQKLAIDDLSPEALFSLSGAYDAVNKFSYGGASKFKSLLKCLRNLPGFDDRILREEPFLRTALDVIRVRCLRDLKDRARIPLPDSYVLVGVPDEDHLLEPNQVYACLRFPERPEAPVYLKGRVLVTRSPAMDPGDLRVLDAVGRLPSHLATRMRSLENCLVLSTKGQRSVASMMGGGDLDGDTYQIITLPELIPADVAPPRPHDAQDPLELDRPAQIEDVSDCFVNYLCNDTVGQIAHLHLCLADRSPAHGFDPRCQQLADLYSLAVDAPKTGYVVPVEALPRVKRKARPDFMRRSDTADITVPADAEYYRSERALGYLYRSVDDSGVATPTCLLEAAVEDGKSHSLERVHITIKHDLAAIFDASPERLQGIIQRHEPYIRPILEAFSAALSDIAVTHTPPRQDERKLSEVEIFAVATLLEVQRGEAARGNTLAAMAQQVSALVEWLASCLEGESEADGNADDHADVEKLGLRYAAWRLASVPAEDDEEGLPFGAKTSRWVCLTPLLESLTAENQRREDARLGVTRGPPFPTTSRILRPAGQMPTHVDRATLLPARPPTSSARSKELSSASPRHESLPSSESYKRVGTYASAHRPPLSSSTFPTSDELENPVKEAIAPRGLGQHTATARLQPAISPSASRPAIRISPSQSSASATGESTSAAAYIAALLQPQVTPLSSKATKAGPPRARPLAPPRAPRKSDDSSDSLIAEAEHRRAYEELQRESIEFQRLQDEEEARERLYEEFRRRQHIKGIHVPSSQHEPHAYQAHREDFLASLRPSNATVGVRPAARSSSSSLSRDQEIERCYSAASMPPSTSGQCFPSAPEWPRPPPTRYTPGSPEHEATSRTPSPTSAAVRSGWPTGGVSGAGSAYQAATPTPRSPPSFSKPSGPHMNPAPAAQWPAVPQALSAEGTGARWPTGRAQEWRSRSPSPPTPPPARREYFRDEPPPFWALFDDIDKERYKSNQTGLGKLGRYMVTSDGQTYRDAYGLGKPTGPKKGGGRAYRSKGNGRHWDAETSWLQDMQRQVNDELSGWGQRSTVGGASRTSGSAWGAEPSQRGAWK